MLADRGYDADWFRHALEEKGIKPCILGRKSRGDRSNTTRGNTSTATLSRLC
jgi:tetraacyldisaccharide-1-P 4'-kinase